MFDIETASKEDFENRYAELKQGWIIFYVVAALILFSAIIVIYFIGNTEYPRGLSLDASVLINSHEHYLLGVTLFLIAISLWFLIIANTMKHNSMIIKMDMLLLNPKSRKNKINKKKVKK